MKTLSNQEINSFEEFLNSPFHNKNNKIILLFGILKKYHPCYDDDRLTKEMLFGELYGNEKFTESYIRNLFSDMKISLEQFLIHSHLSRSSSANKILIEELNNRELTTLLNQKIEAFEKEIAKRKLMDQEYYSDKLFIYDMKSFLFVDRTLANTFHKEQVGAMINFFLISLMESSFHLIVEEQRIRIKHDTGFTKHVLEYVKSRLSEFSEVPLLMIFYYLWMSFFDDQDEENFRNAREQFRMHFDTLTQVDKKNIYAVMQLYYDKKIRQGITSYNRHLLNLLLEMLNNKITSHRNKNYIHLNLYRNILILCFKLNETERLKIFAAGYLKFIRAESRKSIAAYSSAHIKFLEKNFEESLAQCQKVYFKDLLISTNENLYFKLDIKTLIIKCLYELKSYEIVLSHLQAFKQFLNNSKIIKESSKKLNMNFYRIMSEINNLRLNFEEYRLEVVKRELKSSNNFPGAEWLLQKTEEFKTHK